MANTTQESTAHCEFLTNHAKVLLRVADDPESRLRDIADSVGITERAAHRLVSDLVDEGYILRERHGRRNSYKVKRNVPVPDPLAQKRKVGDLLEVLLDRDGRK